MRLDKIMTEYLIRINPKFNEFRQRNGTITVLLKKALYGCVESASLWYQNLGQSLKGLGYIRNEVDICVYNKASKQGVQCTLCVHVDDLMITSKSKKMIAELTDGLLKRYGEITLRHGGLVIIVSSPWTSGSIVIPLLCIGGGLISREVSRRGAALSPVVLL
jgi:Reverse transcriptase (RNA-dependent DNA polymerase)